MTSQDCDIILMRASRMLDGALPECDRSAVETHLDTCGRCRREVQVWHELGQCARDVPVEPLADNTSMRVREALWARTNRMPRRRGQTRFTPWLMVALLLIAAMAAYWVGRLHERRTARPRISSPSVPTLQEARWSDQQRLRAARGLASDVGVIDRIPAPLRRPLLEAQIEHFQLADWALEHQRGAQPPERNQHRDLANLVVDLRSLLHEEPFDMKSLRRLKGRALSLSLSEDVHVNIDLDMHRPHVHARAAIRAVAPNLAPDAQTSLTRFLTLKERFARGDLGEIMMFTNIEGTASTDFDAAIRLTVSRALAEIGKKDLAEKHIIKLEHLAPDVAELLRDIEDGSFLKLEGLRNGRLKRRQR